MQLCPTTPQHSLADFAQRYIDYFEREFDPAAEAYYRFFDSEEFPEQCRALGFEMDCGHSFIAAYGQEAWNDARSLAVVERIDDVRLIGSAIFSQWRYFNHGAVEHAQEKDRQWLLLRNHVFSPCHSTNGFGSGHLAYRKRFFYCSAA